MTFTAEELAAVGIGTSGPVVDLQGRVSARYWTLDKPERMWSAYDEEGMIRGLWQCPGAPILTRVIALALRHRDRASKVFGDGWKLRKYRGRYDGSMALFTAADLAEFPDDDIPEQELLVEAYADGEVHVQASCKWQPRYTREIHKAHAIAAAWKAHEANLTAAVNPTPPNVQGYCEFCERVTGTLGCDGTTITKPSNTPLINVTAAEYGSHEWL